MKKALKFVFSLAAVILAIGAVACAITAYWDTLTEWCSDMKERFGACGKEAETEDLEDDGFSDFVDVE